MVRQFPKESDALDTKLLQKRHGRQSIDLPIPNAPILVKDRAETYCVHHGGPFRPASPSKCVSVSCFRLRQSLQDQRDVRLLVLLLSKVSPSNLFVTPLWPFDCISMSSFVGLRTSTDSRFIFDQFCVQSVPSCTGNRFILCRQFFFSAVRKAHSFRCFTIQYRYCIVLEIEDNGAVLLLIVIVLSSRCWILCVVLFCLRAHLL